jgi:hypothetical protein
MTDEGVGEIVGVRARVYGGVSAFAVGDGVVEVGDL